MRNALSLVNASSIHAEVPQPRAAMYSIKNYIQTQRNQEFVKKTTKIYLTDKQYTSANGNQLYLLTTLKLFNSQH